MISMMLDGDSPSELTLTNNLNIWGTYSGTPTTGSTSNGLNAGLNLGAPGGILFHVNGSERVRINSSGNVGIGSSSSSQKLLVVGTSNDTIDETTGTAQFRGSGGNGLLFGTQASFPYRSYIQSAYTVDTSIARYDLLLNPLGGNVGIGTTTPGATLAVNGSLAKNSGSFKIDHPLPALTETHHLVHSFVEAPDASNLYAGMVDLVDGTATVNIDTAHRMTEGTFEALNTLQSWSSSNESGYAPVKCSVSGNILTIECQDPTSTDTVYYEVRGIRKDQHMLDTEWTDSNGKVITEPLKPVSPQSEFALIGILARHRRCYGHQFSIQSIH